MCVSSLKLPLIKLINFWSQHTPCMMVLRVAFGAYGMSLRRPDAERVLRRGVLSPLLLPSEEGAAPDGGRGDGRREPPPQHRRRAAGRRPAVSRGRHSSSRALFPTLRKGCPSQRSRTRARLFAKRPSSAPAWKAAGTMRFPYSGDSGLSAYRGHSTSRGLIAASFLSNCSLRV